MPSIIQNPRKYICNAPSANIKSRPPQANKIRRSLKISFYENIFAAAFGGLTQDYAVPYLLALKATTKQIGLFTALPNLFSSLVQLRSANFTDGCFSRRSIILTSTFLHAILVLPVIIIPYIVNKPVGYLIFFATLLMGANMLGQGAFVSLLNDYIPAKKRGAFFGWRAKFGGIVSVSCALGAGFIMQSFKDDIIKGIGLVLIIAMCARFLSWFALSAMYEPAYQTNKTNYFSFWDFIRRSKDSNFAKFVFFIAGMNLAINIGAPFFAVFMLRDLKFNYLTYAGIITTVNIVMLFLGARWGRLADRIGNIRVIKFTSKFIITLPFLWMIYHNPVYLVLLQFVGGFAYSGFNLAAANFIYDAATPAKRIRCFSYFNVINSSCVSLGAFLGGVLAAHCPRIFGYQLLFVFMVSGILRIFMAAFFSKRIKEVRKIEQISPGRIIQKILWQT